MTTLKDELAILQGLCDALAPRKTSDRTLAGQQQLLQEVQRECERLKKKWTATLFSTAKEYALKRYVHYHQENIIRLCDTVYIRLEEQTGLESGFTNVQFTLLQILLELNEFLFYNFNGYYNLHSKLPDATLAAALAELRAEGKLLISALEERDLDNELKDCIVAYIYTITEGNRLTYRMQQYFKQVTAAVYLILIPSGGRDLEAQLSDALFYLNFNEYHFCAWLMNNIRKRKALTLPAGRLAMLQTELMMRKALPVSLVSGYEANIPPINLLIENWLREEIRQAETDQPAPAPRDKKLPLTLSVAHLSLFIRLLYEEGFFAVNNVAEIMRFFSRYFHSKRQAEMSAKSMRKAFYTTDQFTAAVVRDLLSRMLQRLNQLFFRQQK